MEGNTRVAVVGAGQAGLATSHRLLDRGVDHIIFDRGRAGDTWRQRWDSFCLVTPNASLNLPGFPYDGDDPDGFLHRDAIVDYVERYRESFSPPVRDGVEVLAVRPVNDGWSLETSEGGWEAESVVIATGSFRNPSIPPASVGLGDGVTQLHGHDYRRSDDLPDGGVLVVGSGQSGCQIADDLRLAGRDVWLAVSRAGRVPRRYRGREMFWWLVDAGFPDQPVQDLPMGPEARFTANPHVSGRDGGKELNLRAFGRDGMHLVGRFLAAEGIIVTFADDLLERLEGADEASRQMERMIDEFITENGIDAPADDRETIGWTPGTVHERIDLAEHGISTVIWATGYRLDFSWIEAPVFGGRGYPIQHRGVTDMPGLYFVGLHAMHTVGSGLFWGVGRDADYLAGHIGDGRRPTTRR